MLGEELRRARKAAGLTQEELAFKAGLDHGHISDLERNVKSPTVNVLFRLCDAMGASAAKIIGQVERRRRRQQK